MIFSLLLTGVNLGHVNFTASKMKLLSFSLLRGPFLSSISTTRLSAFVDTLSTDTRGTIIFKQSLSFLRGKLVKFAVPFSRQNQSWMYFFLNFYLNFAVNSYSVLCTTSMLYSWRFLKIPKKRNCNVISSPVNFEQP